MPDKMMRRKNYDPKYSGKPLMEIAVGRKYIMDIKNKIPSKSGILIVLLIGFIIVDRLSRHWSSSSDELNLQNKGKIIEDYNSSNSGLNPKIKAGVDFKKLDPKAQIDALEINDPQEKEFKEALKHNLELKEGEVPEVPIFNPNLHIKEKHAKLEHQNPGWKNKVIHPKPRDFPVEFLKVPNLVCTNEITLLILVHTDSSNFGARRAIRDTWGIHDFEQYKRFGQATRWKTIFVLGKMKGLSEQRVSEESVKYGDILQGDFYDNMYEDTRKFMMALTWIPDHLQSCKPTFILKTNDNIFLNMFSIIDWLDAKFTPANRNIYMGRLLKLDRPVRDQHDPMYVPEADYRKEFFPDIIRGPVYLFDTDTYLKLSGMRSSITPIAMEDGYIGLLAEALGIKPIHNDHFQMLEQTTNHCHNLRLFFLYKVTAYQHILIFQSNMRARSSNECHNAQVIGKNNKIEDVKM